MNAASHALPLSAPRQMPPRIVAPAYKTSSKLWLCVYFPDQDPAFLEHWARRALSYSAQVAVEPPALLLEVQGSLRLFGGLNGLRRQLDRDLSAFNCSIATAPTPLAARWLALAGVSEPVFESRELPARLAGLPIRSLDWPEAVVKRLESFGLSKLGEVLRLPRAGIARRLGKNWPLYFERALGHLPDPRETFKPPDQFNANYELPRETETCDELMPALKDLLSQLELFLVKRDRGVQALQLLLHYQHKPCTQLDLHLRRPVRKASELLLLLSHRLESVAMPAPVRALTMKSDLILPWQAPCEDFLGDGAKTDTGFNDLITRLQARLGEQAIYSVEAAEDHRPEHAWRKIAPGKSNGTGIQPVCERPLWLLPEPRHLGSGSTPAQCCLLQGPERIVSGWWDDVPIARDYYQARHADGSCLWVFRNLTGSDWFLHGIFP